MAGEGNNYAVKAAATLLTVAELGMRYGARAMPTFDGNNDEPIHPTTIGPTYMPPSFDGLDNTLKAVIGVVSAVLGVAAIYGTYKVATCFRDKFCAKPDPAAAPLLKNTPQNPTTTTSATF